MTPPRPKRRWLWLVALGCVGVSVGARAHQGLSSDLARLDERLAIRPHDVDLLLDRSVVHRRMGSFAAALADLEQVASLAPAHRRMLVERGLTFFAMKDYARAERDLDLFLSFGLGSVEAFRTRAQLREATGRPAQAIEDYGAALRLSPSPELFLARGKLQEAAGELAAAAQGYEEGLRLLGGAVALRLALLRVEKRRGQYDRAVALVDEVLPALQVKADWLLERAELHAAAGRAQAARRDRQAALDELNALLRQRPNALWLVGRARALLALGRKAEAIADLERATALAPKLEEARELLKRTKAPPERKAK
jgi:tetratricopeptide (TPR) repeat protein